MFPILNAIPGIHATIVGVLAAFFSAFLIFAYQKVTEAQKKLEKVLKVADAVSTPSSFVINISQTLIKEDGDLDWDAKCQPLIQKAASVFYYLNAVKHGIDLKPFDDDINPKEIVNIVDELMSFFTLFFTSYPMNGKSIVTTDQTKSRDSDNQLFDYNRYLEIQGRINYLIWVWSSSQESLIHLFNVYDQIKEKKIKEEKNAEILRVIGEAEKRFEVDQEVRQRLTSDVERHFQSRLRQKHLPLLIEFFQKIQTYQTQVMPFLDESILEFESYNNEFKLKKLTKIGLGSTIYIMVSGIVLPLLILEIMKCSDDSYKNLISFLEYSLLIASFSPYFYICYYFWKKIENTIFK
ncbi:hypothetical protein ABLB96_14900 [Acinetobacter sp. XH1741]|uniref:hypothetical protein n=1 Tax=unclassified Acinetobacter TaxID=196816 RepID=UPI0032B40FD2